MRWEEIGEGVVKGYKLFLLRSTRATIKNEIFSDSIWCDVVTIFRLEFTFTFY